jgi:hypothetical protein
MHLRIAVAFRGGCQQKPGAVLARDFQHVARPRRAHVQGLNGMFQIILGTRQRRQVQHPIHRPIHFQRATNVPLAKGKRWVTLQMLEISRRARNEIIQPDHGVAFPDQPVAEVRTDKAGRA